MIIRIHTIIALLFIINVSIFGQAVLLDKTTGQRISYAQILNEKGAVVGMTDIDGNLPQDLIDEKITIQHIAYNPETVESSLFKNVKSVFLSPIDYKLDEVTVTTKNTEYIHLRTYFRSYQLNDSCLKYFKDGILDFFIDTKHQKTERIASNIRTFQNDSLIGKDKRRTNAVVDKYIYTPYLEGLTLIETLKKEGWKYNTDSVDSRLCLNETVGGAVKSDTLQKLLRVEYDALSTKKKKVRTLFGYTTRLENYYQTECYKYTSDYHSYIDLINRKDYRKLFYSHKKDTKEQMIEVFDELFVLEHEYVSKDKMKLYKKERKAGQEDIPDNPDINTTIVTPLAPQLEHILKNNMSQVE